MAYLFDTNVCIRLLNNTSAPLVARLRSTDPNEILLCSVVLAELTFGAYRSTRVADNLRLLQNFAAPYRSLAFDDSCVDSYGRIRSDLQRAGILIGPNDLLIAAIAVANNLTLVTNNTGEFSRVAGLSLEDWSLPQHTGNGNSEA